MNASHDVFASRLLAFQEWVKGEGLDWFWAPASDAHLSEYLPLAAKRRDWLCGFDGSAGDLLVGLETAWLFVDSRYHEQAATQVPTEQVQIAKVGLPEVPTLSKFLEKQAKGRTVDHPLTLGVDSWTLAASGILMLQETINGDLSGPQRLTLRTFTQNPIDTLRAAHNELPHPVQLPEIFGLSPAVTGQTSAEKLTVLRKTMADDGVTLTPVTRLDEVAWLTNLRGQDIAYNPVFHSYALVGLEAAWLFVDVARVDDAAQLTLAEAGWTLLPYEQLGGHLIQLPEPHTVAWAAAHHTFGLYEHLKSLPAVTLTKTPNRLQSAKSLKNPTELAGMREANLRASRAICRLLAQLDQWAQDGQTVTEAQLAATLEGFYGEEPGFFGLSFNTIAGSGANSSIVHYGTPDDERAIVAGDWVLVDSGIQLLRADAAGTTDCTRTTAWARQADPRQQQVYTLVLKGHIAAARAIVPPETPGAALDALCRGPIWAAGLDYGHGTGHGVGAFLNVHEGPNGIHKKAVEPLKVGQICSIEPGYYEPGWGGVRLENLAEVVAAPEGFAPLVAGAVQGGWLTTRPITWVPFESALIDESLLSPEDIDWLSHYHATVLETVAPLLADDAVTLAWLHGQTQRWL